MRMASFFDAKIRHFFDSSGSKRTRRSTYFEARGQCFRHREARALHPGTGIGTISGGVISTGPMIATRANPANRRRAGSASQLLVPVNDPGANPFVEIVDPPLAVAKQPRR